MAIVLVLLLTLLITSIIYIEVKKYFINKKLHGFEPTKGILPIFGTGWAHYTSLLHEYIEKTVIITEYHSFVSVLRVLGTSNTSIDVMFKLFDETKSTIVRYWVGWMLAIATYDPKTVGILLTNEQCLNKPYLYRFLHVNSSLLVVDKESWKIERRELNSAFGASALRTYLPLLNKKIRILVDRIEPHGDERCDVYRGVFIGMLDTNMRALMGVDMNLQSDRGGILYKTIQQITKSIMHRSLRFWLLCDLMYYNLSKLGRAERYALKVGNDFIDEIYSKKINELKLQQSQSNGVDYLEEVNRRGVNNLLEKCLLLERDRIFSHETVLDNMRVAIVAGIDTSAITVFGKLILLQIYSE